ncbi:Succinyl-CoA:3-ketoacid-coenzyme A transferase subunit A [Verticillium dahliae VDG1]|nr:Succinyl-CoA:3-ketoacid-coenzyme A transferase subunit A [Verticillium dahliae VDG1]
MTRVLGEELAVDVWDAVAAELQQAELHMIVNSAANDTYGWSRCYDEMTDDDEMTDAAAIVNAADPDALVIYSGLNYDHKLNPITAKLPLSETDPRFFDLADFDYADNIVFELHTYDNWMTNCTFFQSKLCSRGFHALDMSAENYLGVYAQCLKDFTGDKRIGAASRIEGPIGWLQ